MKLLVRSASQHRLTIDQYDEALRCLQEAGDFPPAGMEYHVAFFLNGNLRVSEIWSSREQLNAFVGKLRPVLIHVGIAFGEPEILRIHNIIRP